MSVTPHERFAAKILCDLRTQCWLWTGAQCGSQSARHGYFWLDGKGVVASVYAWEQAHGRNVTTGMLICHARYCSSSLCVRPSHLYEGTQLTNHADRVSTITHCKRGHPFDEANTYVTRERERACRTCNRELMRKKRAHAVH